MLAPDGHVPVTRHLIVNADDFGQSESINQGVIRAHDAGIVTSASLMVRWPAAVSAAAAARERPSMTVGLHLDLGEWQFRAGEWEARNVVIPTFDEEVVRREVAAQLSRFERLLGSPTHLDSHQHVHRDGAPATVLREAAAAIGVPLRDWTKTVRYSGDFYGQSARGELLPERITVPALIGILEALPTGITELGCHPATSADVRSSYSLERPTELATLCDPRIASTITRLGIVLCSFSGVKEVLQ